MLEVVTVGLLVYASYDDLKNNIVRHWVPGALILSGLLYHPFLSMAGAALVGAALAFIMELIGSIARGDVYLSVGISAALGRPDVALAFMIYLAFMSMSWPWMMRKDPAPFAPAFLIGFLLFIALQVIV